MKKLSSEYQIHDSKNRRFMPVDGIFILYMLVLLRITVFRSGFTWSGILKNGTLNFIPFVDLFGLLKQGRWMTVVYLFVGNLIWFLPLGSYLAYRKKQSKLLHICVYGFLVSLAIEAGQFVFGTGVSDVEDLLLNTLGTFCGALLVRMTRRPGGPK